MGSLGPRTCITTALNATAAVQGLISLHCIAFPYLAVEAKATHLAPKIVTGIRLDAAKDVLGKRQSPLELWTPLAEAGGQP